MQTVSKEAPAIAALGANPSAPHQARRVRRYSRLVQGLMPFAILVGLTIFAIGLVRVVEIGAAKSSTVKSKYTVEAYEYAPPEQIDFELAQQRPRNLVRRHAELKASRKPARKSQIAYPLSLEAEMQRDSSGLSHVAPHAEANASDDVMDWSLFEQGSKDPLSTLQRTGSSPTPATH